MQQLTSNRLQLLCTATLNVSFWLLHARRVHIQTVQRGLRPPAASRVFGSASEHVAVTVTRPEPWRSAKNGKYGHSLGFVWYGAGEINTEHNKHHSVLELTHVYVGYAGCTGHIRTMKEFSLWRVTEDVAQVTVATDPIVSINGMNIMENQFYFTGNFWLLS